MKLFTVKMLQCILKQMNKRIINGIVVLLLLLAIGSVYYFFVMKQNNETVDQKQDTALTLTQKLPSKKLKTYKDSAGFTFQHPDNITIDVKENTDSNTYSDLDLRSKVTAGNISIKVTDTKLKTTNDWVQSNKVPQSKDSQLGNLSAKEIQVKGGYMIGAVDQGILFQIAVYFNSKDEFWQKSVDIITSTFNFTNQASSTPHSSTDAGGDEVILEAEEVVE